MFCLKCESVNISQRNTKTMRYVLLKMNHEMMRVKFHQFTCIKLMVNWSGKAMWDTSYHSTCRYLSVRVSTCQYASVHFSTCQCMSVPVSTCQYMSAPISTCQYVSVRVSTCQYVSVRVNHQNSWFLGDSSVFGTQVIMTTVVERPYIPTYID